MNVLQYIDSLQSDSGLTAILKHLRKKMLLCEDITTLSEISGLSIKQIRYYVSWIPLLEYKEGKKIIKLVTFLDVNSLINNETKIGKVFQFLKNNLGMSSYRHYKEWIHNNYYEDYLVVNSVFNEYKKRWKWYNLYL